MRRLRTVLELAPATIPLIFIVLLMSQSSVAQGSRNHAPRYPRYKVVDLGPIQTIASDIVPGLNSSGDTVIWRQEKSLAFAPVLIRGHQQMPLKIPQGY